MNLNLSYIAPQHIAAVLPKLREHLATSEKWTSGRAKASDIAELVAIGAMQLWVVYDQDTNEVFGHVITEVKQYPQRRMLVIQYCAMKPHLLQHVEDKMQTYAESFAKENGCDGIELVGRPGWGRRLEKYGYEAPQVVYQKFFGG